MYSNTELAQLAGLCPCAVFLALSTYASGNPFIPRVEYLRMAAHAVRTYGNSLLSK
jgi:hypothetical protein